MPELPDIEAYLAALRTRVLGRTLEHIRIGSPFLLRTVDPPLASVEGQPVTELRRIGKRIVFTFAQRRLAGAAPDDRGPPPLGQAGSQARATRRTLAAFDFAEGSLTLTEAGSKRRASLHVVRGEEPSSRARPRRPGPASLSRKPSSKPA